MPIAKMIGAAICLALFASCFARRLILGAGEPVTYAIMFAIGAAASAYVLWMAVQEYRVLRSKTP